MNLYVRVVVFNLAAYIVYPLELVASIAQPLIELGFLLLFWSVVAVSSAGGINFRDIFAYFVIATAVSNLVFINNLRFGTVLARSIKYGDINYSLLRPVHVPSYYLASMIGSTGAVSIVSVISLVIGLIIEPPASLLSIMIFLVYLPIAVAISYGLNLIVGTVAFYTTEVSSIKNVLSHIINVFSGALIPLTFFPSVLKLAVQFLPFSAVIFGPVQALRTTTLTHSVQVSLASGLIWAVLLVTAGELIWRRGMRRYEAVGL